MRLCGVLGAEIVALPAPLARETGRFFERNLEWLTQLFGREDWRARPEYPRVQALRAVAALDGAMILARTLDDLSVFDDIAAGVPRASQAQPLPSPQSGPET